MRNFAVCCMLAVAMVLPAHGGTNELEAAVLEKTGAGDRMQFSRSDRKQAAAAMLVYWQNISDRVPRLSPDEKSWVERELAGGIERARRLVKKPEYALWELDIRIDFCLQSLASLMETQELERQVETEMFYWLKVAHCYYELDEVSDYVQKAGLTNGRDGKFSFVFRRMITSNILNYLTPSAMADTMGWSLSKN